MEKSWEDIPIWFKKEMVSYLDFKSRRQLRACSKQDQFLVDNCPLPIKKLAVFLTKARVSIYLTATTKTITKHSYNDNRSSPVDLLQDFVRLFQHPKSLVEELTMEFSDMEKSKMLIEQILGAKEKLKIQVKKIVWYSSPTNLYAVDFVKLLDNKTLKTIRFEYQSKNLEMMKKLMKTEQWRWAEELTTSSVLPVGVDIEKFSHSKRLKIKVQDSEFNVDKIQNIITRFKNSNHPLGSYFSILTNLKKDEEPIQFSKPIFIDGKAILPKTRTFFPMPDSGNFLLIHRYDHGVEGLVRDNDEPLDYFIL